jgi:hypothetical protein
VVVRTRFLYLPVAYVMGIENGCGVVCGVGFVVQELAPCMATKQASSILLGPFPHNLDDTQTGSLQAVVSG